MATETSDNLPTTMSMPALTRLPPELMIRALSFLDTEMLPAVRLTCKKLDSIVFDRFAETHFAHIYCWICKPAAFRRLKDILQNSPVLRAKIRHVTLTDNPFEDLPPSALHVIRESDQKTDNTWDRVFTGYNLQQEGNIMTTEGLFLMQRVLRDLKELPQDISVTVDLTRNGGWFHQEHEYAFQATLFAVAMSQTAVDTLTFDDRSLEHIDDILAHGRADFLASVSTVTSLTCLGDIWLHPGAPNLAIFIEILQSMTRLRHLTFATHHLSDDGDHVGWNFDLLRVPRKVWRAIDFSNLVSLDLVHVVLSITEQELNQITAQCRSTLKHVRLSRVALSAGDWCWKRVGEVLLTMPGLVFVELQMIRTKDSLIGFWRERVTTLSEGDPPGVRLEGRCSVIKGLQELACLGPSFFEQLE